MAKLTRKERAKLQSEQHKAELPQTTAELKKPAAPKKKPATPVSLPKDSALVKRLGWILALLAVVVYFNSLFNDYAFDDYGLIVENRQTKQGWSAIDDIFRSSYRTGTVNGDATLYRPLSKMMFAAEWSMAGGSPWLGHFMNVALFALSVVLLFRMLRRYMKENITVPFIASVLFAVHPIHTEVVANIKGRDDILCFLFFVCTALYVHRYMALQKTKDLLLAGVMFFLCTLSKESAITFVAVIPLMMYFFIPDNQDGVQQKWLIENPPLGTPEKLRRRVERQYRFRWLIGAPQRSVYITLLGVAILFLGMRALILPGGGQMSAPVVDNYIAGIDGFLAQRATAITIAGLYLLKLCVPFGLVSDASWPQMQAYGFGDWQFLVSLLVFLAMIVFAVMKFKNKHPVAFGILYFFITFSIVSNIPFLIGTNYAERLLYTPSLGIFIAVAWVLHRLLGAPEERPATLKEYFTPQAKVVGVLCVPVIIYSGITVMRNPVWKDNQTLYGTDALISSESCKTHYLVANHWTMGDTLAYYAQTNPAERTRRIDTAIVEFRRAAELNPEFADALQRLGEMYHLKGQSDSAEACYRRAIWLLPQFATYRNNFGKMLFDLQRYEEAAYQFEMAVRFNPYYAAALNNLAGCYGTKASKYVQLAQSNPALAAEYNQKAVEWFQRSLQQSLKAIAVDPGFINAYETTAQTYALLGDNVSAQKYRTKAQELIKSGQGNRG